MPNKSDKAERKKGRRRVKKEGSRSELATILNTEIRKKKTSDRISRIDLTNPFLLTLLQSSFHTLLEIYSTLSRTFPSYNSKISGIIDSSFTFTR